MNADTLKILGFMLCPQWPRLDIKILGSIYNIIYL